MLSKKSHVTNDVKNVPKQAAATWAHARAEALQTLPLNLKSSTPQTIPLTLPTQIELAEAREGRRKTLRD